MAAALLPPLVPPGPGVTGAVPEERGHLAIGEGTDESAAADLDQATVRALYAIALHGEWPRYRFRDAHSPFVVGILGDTPLARHAREFFTERRTHRRPIQIVAFRDAQNLGNCHLLFTGHPTPEAYVQVQAFARGRQILLVASDEPPCEPLPAVTLLNRGERLGVRIDRDACRRSGVLLSPQLLALSRGPGPREED